MDINSKQIQQNKQYNPDDIYKVPVDFGGFHPKVAGATVMVSILDRSPQHCQNQHHTYGDVESVETSQHIKSTGEQISP
jgi:hypothetical protein